LLYTAITRGKRLVIIVGSPKAMHMAVANDKTRRRYTWLAQRLNPEKGRTVLKIAQTLEEEALRF
jgi:exodeoxyribonuclease V alpha subunit